MFEKVLLGSPVFYVMSAGDFGEGSAYKAEQSAQGGPAHVHVRPAAIVETWGNENQSDKKNWTVNLAVLCDGANDGQPGCILWKTSVQYSEDRTPGTWHL